ncbi:MAG: hypothetical protein WD801_03635 [Gemmatimonadaceae bacterium]
MKHACIFCNRRLGENDLLEQFPVGRRLAYDAEHARLWVVCGKCRRWNMAPLDADERGGALDGLERTFRDARWGATSDNIGLARLDSGVELVRIGRAPWPELASWRYGRSLARRHHLNTAGTVFLACVATLAATGLPLLPMMGIIATGTMGQKLVWRVLKLKSGGPAVYRGRPGGAGDAEITVRLDHLEHVELAARGESDWEVRAMHENGAARISGPAAVNVLRHLTPRMNYEGGTRAEIRDAVERIRGAGHPSQVFARVARSASRGARLMKHYSRDEMLAIEIAAHEDAERRAMDGELALLEHEWRRADEIAGIVERELA